MRTLNRNTTKVWKVAPATMVEQKDGGGFLTGEFEKTFGSPVAVFISLYPSNGVIAEELFGKDYSCDMISVSNDVILTKDTLLFLSSPTSNYDTTYDYKVDKINKSLNTYSYGLRRRT